MNKYHRLQRSQLSIFSRNCFGLPFRSPIVNLFLSAEDEKTSEHFDALPYGKKTQLIDM